MISLFIGNDIVPVEVDRDMYVIEKETGYKELHFFAQKSYEHYDSLLDYAKIEYDNTYYRIREVHESGSKTEYVAQIDREDFKKYSAWDFNMINSTEKTILSEVCKNIGWTVTGISSNVRSTVSIENGSNGLDIVLETSNVFGCVFDFDNKNKVLNVVYLDNITDKGLYVTDQLNLSKPTYDSDTYDIVTRVYARGKKDDDTGEYVTFKDINGGKDYVECFDYTTKVVPYFVSDERFTIPQDLLDYSKKILSERCKPIESYVLDVKDIYSTNSNLYKDLEMNVRDVVTYMDRSRNRNVQYRIIEFQKYPYSGKNNKITLSDSPLQLEQSTKISIDEIAEKVSQIDGISESVIGEIKAAHDYVDKSLNIDGTHGYVTFNKNDAGVVNEIYIADNPNLDLAKNVLRINNSGIGGSTSGKNGPYNLGMLIDGTIDATMIAVGTLRAIDIMSCELSSSTITGTTITGGDINGTTVTGGTVNGTEINGGKIIGTKINGGDVEGVNITGSTYTSDFSGYKALEISGSDINFYDWYNPEHKYIGSISSSMFGNTPEAYGIQLYHTPSSEISISYMDGDDPTDSTNTLYMRFDKNGGHEYPIMVYEDAGFNGNVNISGSLSATSFNPLTVKTSFIYCDGVILENDGSIGDSPSLYGTSAGNGILDAPGVLYLTSGERINLSSNGWDIANIYGNDDDNYIDVTSSLQITPPDKGSVLIGDSSGDDTFGISVYKSSDGYHTSIWGKQGTDDYNGISLIGNAECLGGLYIFKDLVVKGNKNRAVKTENYDYVLMNAVESATALFEDNGTATLNDAGTCIIELDDRFLETVNTDCEYYVQLTKNGLGDVYTSEKGNRYFVVSGTPNLSFDWCVKCRQTGYENTRLNTTGFEEENKVLDKRLNDVVNKMESNNNSDLEKALNSYEDYIKELTGGNE